MKKIFIICACFCILCSCSCYKRVFEKINTESNNSSDCISLGQEINFLLQNFESKKKIDKLKKANMLIDSALNHCNDKISLLRSKFEYFLNIQDYHNGIIFFQNIDTTIYPDSYLNNFYINSFKVKLSDSLNSLQIYQDMHFSIEGYLNRIYFDNMDLNSNFMNRFINYPIDYCGQNFTAVVRYFSIRAKIFGIEDVLKYLKELKPIGSSEELNLWNNFYYVVLISRVQDVNNADYIMY